MMRVGIASDHAGFELKSKLLAKLVKSEYEVRDLGTDAFDAHDDYPDYIIPLARAVAADQVERGIAICGSGAGACIVANKIPGVRAALVHEAFTARQGVEDDDMNVICLGGRVVGPSLAWELVHAFLTARFTGAERHLRRLAMVRALEQGKESS